MNRAYTHSPDKYSVAHRKLTDFSAISTLAQNSISTLLNDYRSATAIRLRDCQKQHNGPKARSALVSDRFGCLPGSSIFLSARAIQGIPDTQAPFSRLASVWQGKLNTNSD
jgi:hypothetical protein